MHWPVPWENSIHYATPRLIPHPPSHPPILHSGVNTLFSFCKNVAFPAEYSYFLPILGWNILVFFNYSFWHFRFRMYWGKIEVNARFFFVFVKTQNCPFQNLSLGFILIILLQLCKFSASIFLSNILLLILKRVYCCYI